eukprot:12522778-Heterocapsa_arctica.AAC.1
MFITNKQHKQQHNKLMKDSVLENKRSSSKIKEDDRVEMLRVSRASGPEMARTRQLAGARLVVVAVVV